MSQPFQNKFCMRCGNCCRGLVWKRWFSFKDALRIAKGAVNKSDVENAIVKHYREYLNKKGQKVEDIYSLEWDRKNQKILVQAKVGKCQHLDFDPEGKAKCMIYHKRPEECRSYLCKKVRRRMKIKKMGY